MTRRIHSCHDPVKDPPLLTTGRPGEREDAMDMKRPERTLHSTAQGVRAGHERGR
ncbi:MAG: hypothetical protein ACM3ZU_08185 [Bacteroidota bacterium]